MLMIHAYLSDMLINLSNPSKSKNYMYYILKLYNESITLLRGPSRAQCK